MRIYQLTSLACGLTLAFGVASSAMAENTATIYQNGFGNDSSIEQYDNQNAAATVTTYGSFNDNVVVQQDTQSTTANILTSWGNNNDNYINQEDVQNSSADVFQNADFSKVVIEQGGTTAMVGGGCGWLGCWPGFPVTVDGTNQVAAVNQLSGWGHDAYIGQTGHNVSSTITQSGHRNKAVSVQRGTGGDPDSSIITQSGSHNFASVDQYGKDLTSTVSQTGSYNVANVMQKHSGQTATVTQVGHFNKANVIQH